MLTPFFRRGIQAAGVLVCAVVVPACASKSAPKAGPVQSTFETPVAAAGALFDAVQRGDQSAMLQVLGPDADDLVSSGDEAADRNARENFVTKYRQMHRIGLDGENRTALIIGAENWPFPIPLVQQDSRWVFDTAAGKQEVLYRRIGRNEASAIQICEELVAAQKEYFAATHDGDATHQYAQHFVSTPGHHDGLFWDAGQGQADSPIGPLLAFASSEQASKAAHAGPTPFHGYFFRLLRAEGPSGAGTRSFIVNGKMTRGFAFLAYPAEYRSSGVMTFLVGEDGIVRQKDLGADLAVAKGITAFDVDATWAPAE